MKELQHNDIDIIESEKNNTIIVKELKSKVDLTKYIEEHRFAFDHTYDETSTNQQIYNDIVKNMITAAFNQTKITCFAYGQTGSGKTFTMMGDPENKVPGWYLLSANDIFTYLKQPQYSHLKVWVSFYEIYCNKLFDWLNNKYFLQAREDGKGNICIVGLIEKEIKNIKEWMTVIDYGLQSRTTGVTGANMDSSRSHAIMQITIKDKNNVQGKISFIDWAGSERAVDTIDTNKQTKIDGAEINKSLLALKECIRALDQEKRHTPFRASKLTLVLRDSFVGNCLTLMITNISPCLSCSEHTLNTLRYADRVKELRKGKYDKERSSTLEKKKDPDELLANLLMMPRQHNKTVKYKVDISKGSSSGVYGQIHNNINVLASNTNSSTNKITKPNKAADGITHINDILKTNKINKHKITKKSNRNSSKEFNDVANRTTHFSGAHYENYNSQDNNDKINSSEDYKRVYDQHEKLINEILKEEESFINFHKSHINHMVDSIKEEMNMIKEVDEPGSNIERYTESVDKVLLDQIEEIQRVRKRLGKFKVMIKEEAAISNLFDQTNPCFTMGDEK